MKAIEDDNTFAATVRYALEKRIIRQTDLASRLRYVNSQVGRWAMGRAMPPVVVRERVIDILRELTGPKTPSRQDITKTLNISKS